jgi:NarL family two-component system response regulator LiaR
VTATFECGWQQAVLVDEHPLWLDAVEHVLERVRIRTVARATSVSSAERMIAEHRPDLVVAEIVSTEMELAAALTWVEELVAGFEGMKVIVLSSCDDPGAINTALAAGAAAYVVKKAHPDDLAVAVRQTFQHSLYLAPYEQSNGRRVAAVVPPEDLDLTTRELQILRLVAEGLSNAEMAQLLTVTEQTVKFHLSNIYRKLDVSNRTEASRWAQLNGLLPATPLRVAVP